MTAIGFVGGPWGGETRRFVLPLAHEIDADGGVYRLLQWPYTSWWYQWRPKEMRRA